MDYQKIGQRVREEREKFNLTREKLAELVELSSIYIGQIERGERKMSLDTLAKLSTCLHLSLDYLVKGSPAHEEQLKDPSFKLAYLAKDNFRLGDTPVTELQSLISKCSSREITLITDLIKIILPYLGRK